MTDNHHGQTGSIEDSGLLETSEGAYEAYFSTPARQGLIQQLLHLIRFGDGIPVVQGSGRCGKTAIAKALLSQLEDVPHRASVTVKAHTPFLEVLVEVLRQYGFGVDGNVSEGELLAELRRFSQALTNDKKLGVLLLDNAHYLDDQSLGALVSLLQGLDAAGHGLHLVFFAQPDLVSRLDDLGLLDISVYDFDMPLMSPSELSDFLKKHLEYQAEPNSKLSADTVQAIWSRSRGAPGYSLRLMWETIRSTSPGSKPLLKNIPVGHMVALSVLAAVLVWALLIGDADSELERTVSEVALSSDSLLPDQADEFHSDRFQATDFQALVEEKRKTTMSDEAPADSLSDRPVDEIIFEIGTEKVEAPAVIANPDNSQVEGREVGQEQAVPQSRRSIQIEGSVDVASQPVSSGLTRLETPRQDGRGVTADEKFLLDQSPVSYTLQIMAASKKEALENFIDGQVNKDSLFLYQGQRAGKAWFIVTAGIYPNRDAAAAAISKLPVDQKKGGPWPRQLQNIQGEINENKNK